MKKIHINIFFVGFIIFLFIQCDYRTPSRVRFSKVCDIEIPKTVEVIRDEYHNVWQDYAIYYEIKLTKESQDNLTESIRKSKFYNPKIFINEYVTEDMFLEIDSFKAVWAETKNGYMFKNELGRDNYQALIDTVSRIAKFQEMHD